MYLEKKLQNRMRKLAKVIISIFEKIKSNDFSNYQLWENSINIIKNWNFITFKVEKNWYEIISYELKLEKN